MCIVRLSKVLDAPLLVAFFLQFVTTAAAAFASAMCWGRDVERVSTQQP
jgi:membrane protein implicated in regulation of membrane protease activity